MATIEFSEVIKLIPASKLSFSSVCEGESEFSTKVALNKGLESPIDFPTLDQAILQEDTVCIPVEPGIPNEEDIAAHVAKSVCELGVDPSQITILLPEGASENRIQSFVLALEKLDCGNCSVQVHQAKEKECLGYLGPSQSGEPITLNARLVHADFVLPIGRAKPYGWKSQIDFLYPYFSDLESQKRFFKLNLRHRVQLNQEVHRWLGNCFLVSVATRVDINSEGKRQVIGKALLGENDAVNRAMQRHFQANDWFVEESATSKPQYDLVIAKLNVQLLIAKEEFEEPMQDLLELCSPKGSIVLIWDDDNEIPGLVDSGESPQSDRDAQFPELEDRTVYLCSGQSILRKQGIAGIANLQEMERLIGKHESVLVLPDFINDFAYHRRRIWNKKSTGVMA